MAAHRMPWPLLLVVLVLLAPSALAAVGDEEIGLRGIVPNGQGEHLCVLVG